MAGDKKVANKTSRSLPSPSSAESVDQFLEKLIHPLKPEVETLRRIIMNADPQITDGIKWNAPSFSCGEWFATFDLRSKDWVQIIFHRGAKPKKTGDSRYVKDPKDLLKWITNDRCVVRFANKSEVDSREKALSQIVAEWVRNLRSEAD